MEVNQFLNTPLSQLELTGGFVLQSEAMGFEKLLDVLSCPPAELFEKPGFSYRWFNELVELLTRYELLYLLQPKPGSSAY